MQLKDIMTPGVEVIAPEASIYEAAETDEPSRYRPASRL